MPRTKEMLVEVLRQRLGCAGLHAQQYFDQASEVIVFGSMSAGIDRADSDMDVLSISTCAYKYKSRFLDLVGVPSQATRSRAWLQSELATHVGKYGTWVKGTPEWVSETSVGARVVYEKRSRISAFMRSLEKSWSRLDECFRAKYSVKLRRETQRLTLLERGVPVPPTRILDYYWAAASISPSEVLDHLRQTASPPCGDFLDDLVDRINVHFSGQSLHYCGRISTTTGPSSPMAEKR
jgi:hypothetical protein